MFTHHSSHVSVNTHTHTPLSTLLPSASSHTTRPTSTSSPHFCKFTHHSPRFCKLTHHSLSHATSNFDLNWHQKLVIVVQIFMVNFTVLLSSLFDVRPSSTEILGSFSTSTLDPHFSFSNVIMSSYTTSSSPPTNGYVRGRPSTCLFSFLLGSRVPFWEYDRSIVDDVSSRPHPCMLQLYYTYTRRSKVLLFFEDSWW